MWSALAGLKGLLRVRQNGAFPGVPRAISPCSELTLPDSKPRIAETLRLWSPSASSRRRPRASATHRHISRAGHEPTCVISDRSDDCANFAAPVAKPARTRRFRRAGDNDAAFHVPLLRREAYAGFDRLVVAR
jgi:hypothetical protein